MPLYAPGASNGLYAFYRVTNLSLPASGFHLPSTESPMSWASPVLGTPGQLVTLTLKMGKRDLSLWLQVMVEQSGTLNQNRFWNKTEWFFNSENRWVPPRRCTRSKTWCLNHGVSVPKCTRWQALTRQRGKERNSLWLDRTNRQLPWAVSAVGTGQEGTIWPKKREGGCFHDFHSSKVPGTSMAEKSHFQVLFFLWNSLPATNQNNPAHSPYTFSCWRLLSLAFLCPVLFECLARNQAPSF